MPRLQDCLNFEVELFISILALPKPCFFIYKQMQVIDRIRNKIKLLQLTQISVLIYSSTKIYQVLVINSCANTFFPYFSSSITGIVMPTP